MITLEDSAYYSVYDSVYRSVWYSVCSSVWYPIFDYIQNSVSMVSHGPVRSSVRNTISSYDT